MYARFKEEFRQCWACIYQPLPSELSGYRLEAAHIVGGAGRVADRKAIVCLCLVHHAQNGNGQFCHMSKGKSTPLPEITLGQMCWLKKKQDPEFYDLPFIQECWRKKTGRIDAIELISVDPLEVTHGKGF